MTETEVHSVSVGYVGPPPPSENIHSFWQSKPEKWDLTLNSWAVTPELFQTGDIDVRNGRNPLIVVDRPICVAQTAKTCSANHYPSYGKCGPAV